MRNGYTVNVTPRGLENRKLQAYAFFGSVLTANVERAGKGCEKFCA